MTKSRLLASLLITVTGVTPAAAPGNAAPARTASARSGPAWGACPAADPDLPRDPRQRCAALRVPLDYRNPGGPQITVNVSRLPATDPARRRGALLSNPGGPGAPGLDWPSALAGVLPADVLASYDLIGFDPRGVGTSTPVTCGLPATIPDGLIPGYPAPNGSIARNVAFAKATARACTAHSGRLLPHITTANTARDMDRIRIALGERNMSYLGYSYGTYLGAVYTSLFPRKGDRIVLAGAVDPRLVWYDFWPTWSEAVALRLPDFTAWAAARDGTYHLGGTSAAVKRNYFRIAAALDRKPLELPDATVTGDTFRELTRGYLYGDIFFPQLAEIWQALSGPSPSFSAASLRPLRATVTASPGVPADNAVAALFAIVCGDAAWPGDPAVYARKVAADRRAWPITAGMPANIWPCAFWGHRPVAKPVAVTSAGPRTVLILQNRRDPATSWRSGHGLRVALGGRAAFVTQNAGGHFIYAGETGACVDAIATGFLTTGALPGRDTVCAGPEPQEGTQRVARAQFAPFVPFVL